jgi:hypothetical protein
MFEFECWRQTKIQEKNYLELSNENFDNEHE